MKMCALAHEFKNRIYLFNRMRAKRSCDEQLLFIYELLISGLGNCGMIQLINACGERVCM